MKNFKMMMAFAMIALVFLSSCGSKNASEGNESSDNNEAAACTDNGPKDAYTKLMNYVLKDDFEKAIDMIYEADKASDKEKAELADLLKKSLEAKGGLKDFEILDEELTDDGTKAKLKVKYTYGDGSTKEITDRLIKTDDGWACLLF